MAAFDRIMLEIENGVATVTLNRPDKMNAFDRAMCDELLGALRQVTESTQVRAVVLTGSGRAFCAGADLGVLATDGESLVAAGREIALLIRRARQPVLAAVNGPAAGGGANLALACDYRIASESAQIGQVFHKLGLGQDWGGSYFLPRLVPSSKALELVWSARMVPAAEALQLGLFDRVVPDARLMTEARTLAAAWAAQPPLAVQRAKEGIYASLERSLEQMLDWEVAQQRELITTAEARERLAAQAARRR
jgi:2-(1,2-epoxy-1,2-dihydrophenyl)acetyl-CoA isomerase